MVLMSLDAESRRLLHATKVRYQVIERGVQAFAGASVEFGEWGLGVDQQDGMGGGGLGERGEAAGWLIRCHKVALIR